MLLFKKDVKRRRMNTVLFDLPIELRSLIFSSFSLRDISRLRQCCSAWFNILQDLSFMKVLDFSYSPDITAYDFDQLLEKRIDRTQNNITKVILAHTLHLNLNSLQKLFEVFPRLKDIRIRHGFTGVRTASILSVLLQQQDLECIVYVQLSDTDSPDIDPDLEFKCTKLKRFKLLLLETMCFPCKAMLKLVALNPALKYDLDYLGGIARMFYDNDHKDSSAKPLLELALSSNNLHVYEQFWNEVAGGYRRPSYVLQLLVRTLQLLLEMPDDRRQSNTIVHAICANIRFILREERNWDVLNTIVENRHWLDPLADKCNVDRAKKDAFKLDQWFAMLKKRPFYTVARDAYLSASLEALTVYRRDYELEERYNAELNHLIDTISTVMKTLPFELRLLRASLWLRQGKLKEAFDEFIATMNPTYVLDMEKLRFDMATQNIQAVCGAYHVAKDYLKSPQLLKQLSPKNNKLLHEHFEKLQPCFDRGVCTRSMDNTFRKQYKYVCYTCVVNRGLRGLCYSCTKTCHAGHEIDYIEIAEFTCDDPNCEFEEVPEIEEQADDEVGVQFQNDNVGWENDNNNY